MNFFALDVETANTNLHSICQVGIVKFENGAIVDTWCSLVNPEEYFDDLNVSIHGIDESMVKDAMKIPEMIEIVREKISGNIVIHHMAFDRTAFKRATEKFNLPEISCNWLDSARVSRRAWEKYKYSGYALSNLASEFNLSFQHHDAAEDARIAGEIVKKAIIDTGINLDDWLVKVEKPITPDINFRETFKGNTDGIFFGETMVFTGTLSLPRKEAAKLACQAGCNVEDKVNERTTILVVGVQDQYKLGGFEKSSKHRRAEELIKKGKSIKIIFEEDFLKMINHN